MVLTHIQRAQQNFGEVLMTWHRQDKGEEIHTEFGQLLLFMGICLNNVEMVDTALNNYSSANPRRLMTPWVMNIITQLGFETMAAPQEDPASPTSVTDIQPSIY